MIASLIMAFGQMTDLRFRRVLLRGLAATLALYVLLYFGVGWALRELRFFDLGWANTLTEFLGGLAVLVLSLLLFPGIATIALSFLLEDIAQAVEDRHYPGLPTPRHQGAGELLWGSLRLAGVTVLANLAALPVTLVLMFLGIGVGIYYLLNGYLLAREYFELVAWRRLEPAQSDALRRAHAGRLWALGVVVAFLSSLPLVNLLAPLVATAAMVHECERLRRRDGGL